MQCSKEANLLTFVKLVKHGAKVNAVNACHKIYEVFFQIKENSCWVDIVIIICYISVMDVSDIQGYLIVSLGTVVLPKVSITSKQWSKTQYASPGQSKTIDNGVYKHKCSHHWEVLALCEFCCEMPCLLDIKGKYHNSVFQITVVCIIFWPHGF